MTLKNFFKKFFALMLFAVVAVALVACDGCGGKKEFEVPVDENPVYTYNDYTAVSPSNWNELTYQDNNDTQIMSYISGSFFNYDFKRDANGNILPGEFEVEYSAATKLEDITQDPAIKEKWGFGDKASAQAFRITFRDDLQWEDGTPITAHDFVYTMKEQLDPKFKNYRADSFYVGSVVLVNAEAYAKQGDEGWFDNYNGSDAVVKEADLVKGADGVYTQADGKGVYITITGALEWLSGNSLKAYVDAYGATYFNMEGWAELSALADEKGQIAVTDESMAALEKTISTDAWQENRENVPCYMMSYRVYPEVAFEEVGFYAESDTELVFVLQNPLALLDEEGKLTYECGYSLSGFPLVHKATYEANKVEPTEGNTLWTSTYNSSVESTMSWGPYKLESFEAGKQYILTRNEKYYGYNMPENEGLYQTDRIVCDTIAEWNTAWLKFLAGEIDGIGIDVSIATDYKNSERAYYTPSDYVGSLQLQANKEALKGREEAGINKSILSYDAFRKALSLSIDRADYSSTCTTASLAGFGLFNSMHYYDVANGGVYRNTDYAKQVLCDVYGVNVADYSSLDEAVNAITGYNLTLARQLVDEAYEAAKTAGDIKDGDVVKLTFGSSTINETTQRHVDYLSNAWKELVKGTKLEGKLEVEFKEFGTTWANDFRGGSYDICMGGWSGAAWNPGYFLLAYLSPAYMYSASWKTDEEMMTFTMKGVGENGADVTETMSLINWYNCLNGASGAKYDWSASKLTPDQRLPLIAALEKAVLTKYFTVPTYNNFSASLLSYKVDYVTYEYNTFMSYGGIKYMTYNYSDMQWDALVAWNNGELNYKG